MSKLISYGADSRMAMLRGINQLADTVKITLGPKGRTVAIDRPVGSPVMTKDGVTVAQEITLPDPMENLGAQMTREVAARTAEVAGDGTTTATVLAQVIFREGVRAVTAGMNPMALRRGIDKSVTRAIEVIRRLARPVEGDEIAQVGTISANGDAVTGGMIAEAMKRVGRDGVITVEEAQTMESTLEFAEGMQFDRGFVSPYFVTDTARMEVTLEKPLILLCENKISAINDLSPLLEQVAGAKQALLIVAGDIEGEALAMLVVNKLRGTLRIAAVKAPGYGDQRREMLEDLAIVTGGHVVSEERGEQLRTVKIEDLGRARKIVLDKDKTILIDGGGRPAEIAGRVKNLRAQMEESDSDHTREKLRERMARLAGGVAVIKVGAATELEMKEKKARVEDAMNATRAAVEEGIVPGGGTAYLRAAKALEKFRIFPDGDGDPDEQAGVGIVRRALEEPLRQIAHNSGQEGSIIAAQLRAAKNDRLGYNAVTERIEDLVEAGVIDPAKVTCAALQNAASIAGLLLTTEAMITDHPANHAMA
ncbi:MAG: chaperonin GroEL [Blastocatellia bacterium]